MSCVRESCLIEGSQVSRERDGQRCLFGVSDTPLQCSDTPLIDDTPLVSDTPLIHHLVMRECLFGVVDVKDSEACLFE